MAILEDELTNEIFPSLFCQGTNRRMSDDERDNINESITDNEKRKICVIYDLQFVRSEIKDQLTNEGIFLAD